MANAGSQRERPAHAWIAFVLGRICSQCGLVQENGAFDDTVPCGPRRQSPGLDSAPRSTR